MKTSHLALVFATAMLGQAATISTDVAFSTLSNAIVNVNLSFNILGSIPVGSTLNSLTVELLPSAVLSSSASITNNDPGAATTALFQIGPPAQSAYNFVLTIPDFVAQTYAGTSRNESQGITAFPGPGNTATFAVANDLFANVIGTIGAGDCFDGTCTFTVDKNANALAETANGNYSATVVTQVSGTVRFTWDYTPRVDEVPEPATLAMVSGALLALSFALRKRG